MNTRAREFFTDPLVVGFAIVGFPITTLMVILSAFIRSSYWDIRGNKIYYHKSIFDKEGTARPDDQPK